MRTLVLALVFLAASCRSVEEPAPIAFAENKTSPKVAVLPIHSSEPTCATYFFEELSKRLNFKEKLNLAFSPIPLSPLESKELDTNFLIQLNHSLLKQDQETTLQIKLEVFDLRGDEPVLALRDYLTESTLLNKEPGATVEHISPLGLAHAKLAREVALRIEDTIALRSRR